MGKKVGFSTRSEGDYKGSEYVTWIKTASYTLDAGSTVYDLFTEALSDAGLQSVGAEDNYVETICAPSGCGGYALSEFTNGKYCGWMYTVDDSHPGVGLKYYELTDGETVVWHYVNDYRYEVADWFDDPEYPALAADDTYYNKWLAAADANPPANGHPGSSTPSATLTPSVTASNGKASVTMGTADLTDAISDARENGGTITIAPEITGTASKVSVEIPRTSVSSIGADTSADLTVETDVGSITLSNGALDSIASQASDSNVSMSLESMDTSSLTTQQQRVVGDNPVYDISTMSGDSHISSFDGASITVSLPYTLKDGEDASNVTVWYLNDAGELEQMTCTYDETTGLATFATTHLSYYVVGIDNWTSPFTDVTEEDWFYDEVKFVVTNGLFNGTGDTVFAPDMTMTRAMFATVLYRLDGEPAVTAENPFDDVEDGEWYTDAVIWANNNRIIEGYGEGIFGTNDDVTREQMAKMLYSYADYKGYDVTAAADLAAYTDADEISDWALAAMRWSNAEEVITGRTVTTLVPLGGATRAEVATIFMRFAGCMS